MLSKQNFGLLRLHLSARQLSEILNDNKFEPPQIHHICHSLSLKTRFHNATAKLSKCRQLQYLVHISKALTVRLRPPQNVWTMLWLQLHMETEEISKILGHNDNLNPRNSLNTSWSNKLNFCARQNKKQQHDYISSQILDVSCNCGLHLKASPVTTKSTQIRF